MRKALAGRWAFSQSRPLLPQLADGRSSGPLAAEALKADDAVS